MSKSNTATTETQVTPVTPEVITYPTGCDTKSAKIRYLDSIGKKRGEIAKILTDLYGKTVRYQHVRNVLVTPLKKVG